MTMSRDTALEEWARRILAGETMPEEELEALGPVYGWRLLRWEADIPLPEEQRAGICPVLHAHAGRLCLPGGG